MHGVACVFAQWYPFMASCIMIVPVSNDTCISDSSIIITSSILYPGIISFTFWWIVHNDQRQIHNLIAKGKKMQKYNLSSCFD